MSPVRRAYYEIRKGLTLARKNARDAITLGWRFHLRYVALATRKDEVTVPVRNMGPVRFRLKGSDTETIREIFSHRVYDLSKNPHFSDLIKRYRQSINHGLVPVIIDAGANMGAATIWFAKQFPAAHIMAVEPDPDNARIIRENIALLRNVTFVEGAIGARSGSVFLENTSSESNAIRTVRGDGDGGIRIYTIPDLLNMVERGQAFIIKIDIEGFESDLFSENTAWTHDPDVIIIEPHDWLLAGRNTSAGFQKVLGALGSELFIKGDNLVYINQRVGKTPTSNPETTASADAAH